MANTIVVKAGDGGFMRKEAVASEAITPGHLVEFGGGNELRKQVAAAAPARMAVALENDLVGRGVDDDYASGETVQYGLLQRGEEADMFLANGQNAAKGAPLVSAGAGNLAVMSSGQDAAVLAYALVALNNTSGSAARLRVEAA